MQKGRVNETQCEQEMGNKRKRESEGYENWTNSREIGESELFLRDDE